MVSTPLTSAVEMLKALGHPARLRIVAVLRDGPLSVCQIGAVLGAVPSTVSGHLLDLRRAGLVAEQRHGKWVYYHLDAEPPAKRAVKALLSELASDPQVSEDQSMAAVLRAQSTRAACEVAGPDRPDRPLGLGGSTAGRAGRRPRVTLHPGGVP
jgi:ArsR family transcriptional regulator